MSIDLKLLEVVCDRLSERNAVLFLGAGINFGLYNKTNESFPLGQELSNMLCRDLLDDSELYNLPLEEAAEMVRYKIGEKELNNYLFKLFSSFKPGTAHLSLIQLPWDVIYTTNYDDLLEQSTNTLSINPAGNICPVFSYRENLTSFSEEDILYYKLHGCINFANTEEGRLILTNEDYRYYELHRRPLFRRLKQDLINKTFVFIGYSLKDHNFRNILDDCRNETETSVLPLSYVIWPDFTSTQEAFWKDKYNLKLIRSDGAHFLNELKNTWISQNRSVIPFEERETKKHFQADETANFHKIAESYYHLRPVDCTGYSNPVSLFHGAEPTWADIRDKIAPERDVYWSLFEALIPELSDPTLTPKSYLITGAAGTGKTTLIYSFVYDLAQEFNIFVLLHIPSTPLDVCMLIPFIEQNRNVRIVIVVRHASEYISEIERFIAEAKRNSLPVTFLLEERKNQWNIGINNIKNNLNPIEFELGALTEDEIISILETLNKYNLLGKLTGSSSETQIKHFTALAHKELLVALRELTTESEFDEIVMDEYNKIPSDKAKEAYIYVSALGQFDLGIRYESLFRILDLSYNELYTEIFQPTEGVLISTEEVGKSRHNAGFRLVARHPIIASVIFDRAASNDEKKYEIINNILSQMDPGYQEDRRILFDIVRRRELVNTLTSFEMRRAVYDRLAAIFPSNPYVLQHRSILEKELDFPEESLHYAREAIKKDKSRRNHVLLNTLGLALEYSSRFLKDDPLKKSIRLSEAKKIFDDGIKNNPADPYSYIGQVNVLKHELSEEYDPDKKMDLRFSILSLLEEAYEATNESNIIATEIAIEKKNIGEDDVAIDILEKSLKEKPNELRLRDLLIRFKLRKNEFKEAFELAQEGEKLYPTSWIIQRHLARLKKHFEYPIEAVKGHYEAAIRHHKGDIFLLVELGAYLFTNEYLSDAREIFNKSKNLPISSDEKKRIRLKWKDKDGNEIIFSGEVKSTQGATATAITIPKNYEIFFWKTSNYLSDIREKTPIKFKIGFNAHGPIALNIVKL